MTAGTFQLLRWVQKPFHTAMHRGKDKAGRASGRFVNQNRHTTAVSGPLWERRRTTKAPTPKPLTLRPWPSPSLSSVLFSRTSRVSKSPDCRATRQGRVRTRLRRWPPRQVVLGWVLITGDLCEPVKVVARDVCFGCRGFEMRELI